MCQRPLTLHDRKSQIRNPNVNHNFPTLATLKAASGCWALLKNRAFKVWPGAGWSYQASRLQIADWPTSADKSFWKRSFYSKDPSLVWFTGGRKLVGAEGSGADDGLSQVTAWERARFRWHCQRPDRPTLIISLCRRTLSLGQLWDTKAAL